MLTIKNTEFTDEVKAYVAKNHIKTDLTGHQLMGIFTELGLSGLGSLSLVGYQVYLNFIHTPSKDFVLEHGLAKALLNMADLKGIKTVYGDNPDLEKLYERLRFKKEEEKFCLSLEGYFTADHC